MAGRGRRIQVATGVAVSPVVGRPHGGYGNDITDFIRRRIPVLRAVRVVNPDNPPTDDLPVKQRKEEIVETLAGNNVFVVQSGTGSGKSTLIPVYAKEYIENNPLFGPKGKLVSSSEPRVVAARSLAIFVSRQCDRVGHRVRFQDTTDDRTRIEYVTEGILLGELRKDPLLTKYGVVLVHCFPSFSSLFSQERQGSRRVKVICQNPFWKPDVFEIVDALREYQKSIYGNARIFYEHEVRWIDVEGGLGFVVRMRNGSFANALVAFLNEQQKTLMGERFVAEVDLPNMHRDQEYK